MLHHHRRNPRETETPWPGDARTQISSMNGSWLNLNTALYRGWCVTLHRIFLAPGDAIHPSKAGVSFHHHASSVASWICTPSVYKMNVLAKHSWLQQPHVSASRSVTEDKVSVWMNVVTHLASSAPSRTIHCQQLQKPSHGSQCFVIWQVDKQVGRPKDKDGKSNFNSMWWWDLES